MKPTKLTGLGLQNRGNANSNAWWLVCAPDSATAANKYEWFFKPDGNFMNGKTFRRLTSTTNEVQIPDDITNDVKIGTPVAVFVRGVATNGNSQEFGEASNPIWVEIRRQGAQNELVVTQVNPPAPAAAPAPASPVRPNAKPAAAPAAPASPAPGTPPVATNVVTPGQPMIINVNITNPPAVAAPVNIAPFSSASAAPAGAPPAAAPGTPPAVPAATAAPAASPAKKKQIWWIWLLCIGIPLVLLLIAALLLWKHFDCGSNSASTTWHPMHLLGGKTFVIPAEASLPPGHPRIGTNSPWAASGVNYNGPIYEAPVVMNIVNLLGGATPTSVTFGENGTSFTPQGVAAVAPVWPQSSSPTRSIPIKDCTDSFGGGSQFPADYTYDIRPGDDLEFVIDPTLAVTASWLDNELTLAADGRVIVQSEQFNGCRVVRAHLADGHTATEKLTLHISRKVTRP